MSKVRHLRLTTPKPDKEIIRTLEDLLAEARAGTIKAIAYATVEGSGFIATGWIRPPVISGNDMLASIAVLQHTFLVAIDEGRGQ